MTDLAILVIQIALVAFVAWGGVLSLLYVAGGSAWNFRVGSIKASDYAAANDFETSFRRMLSRRESVAESAI